MSAYLRKANIDDAKIILEWRNDPLTRENSFTKDPVDPETHIKWFNDKLSDENCSLFIMMDDTEQVGQLRIDKVDNIGKISYMIAPDKRNMGYGKQLIKLAEGVIGSNTKVLVGLVESFNEASKKCFIYNDYSELIGGDIACYIKLLK